MKRAMALSVLGFVGLLCLPIAVEGQKKDEKAPLGDGASAQDYAKIRTAREIVGRIVTADANSGTIILRVEPGAGQAKPAPKKGPVNPFNADVAGSLRKDYELTLDKEGTVRRMFTKIEFDDKGNVLDVASQAKTLQSKGYIPVKFETIASGMTAKLILIAPKASADKDAIPKPTVKTVVLLKDTAGPLQQGGTPLKKKKN